MSFHIRVAILSLLCKRHPAPPFVANPSFFLAIRRHSVESASLNHLSCVSLPNSWWKPISHWASAPAVEQDLAGELNTHMFIQTSSDFANTSWQVAHHSEQNHKAFGFDYMKRLRWKKAFAFFFSFSFPNMSMWLQIWSGVPQTLSYPVCAHWSHIPWAEFCLGLAQTS